MAPTAGQFARGIDDKKAAIKGRAFEPQLERLALGERKALDGRVQESGDGDH